MPSVTRGGTRLHYSDTGSGAPIFFHTGGAGDGSMWRTAGYLEALPGYRHLLFDHRGHGQSNKPSDLAMHTLDHYVDDVIAVLNDAGVERAAMVGYSDGAYALFNVAARYPDRVTALVALGGVGLPGETNEYRADLAADVRKTGLRASLTEMSQSESEPCPDWLMENLCATTDEMFAAELIGWVDGPTCGSLFPRIQAPTLIICGESENTDGSAEIAAQMLPNGEAVVSAGYGHLQVFWHADVVAPLIRDFLHRQGV